MENSQLNLEKISKDFNYKQLDEETMYTLFSKFSTIEELDHFYDDYLGTYWDPSYEPDTEDIFIESLTKYLSQFDDDI